MGCECNQKELLADGNIVNLNYFKLCYPIGKGGFGRVWKVELKKKPAGYSPKSPCYFAMKEMSKSKIYLKRSMDSILNEFNFLKILRYPLLANMNYAFQSVDNLYIILDLLTGGDLRYLMCRRNKFTEIEVKFIAINITLALEYIHNKSIVHRDLKPENLVFDHLGYLHLTDFGISKEVKNIKDNTSGTPGYMAPEVLLKRLHNQTVDYYALGVIVYELALGHRPYNGKTRKEIRDQVISREIRLKKNNLPYGFNDYNIIDFINKLLKRKADARLGANGIEEIKKHNYFDGVVWEDYEKMKIESPFKFYKEDNFDKEYANKEDEAVYNINKETFVNNFNECGLFNDFYYDVNAFENQDNYKIYPYMNNSSHSTNVNSNVHKNHDIKTSTADKHTKISSLNGVPTDIYGINDNNSNFNNNNGNNNNANNNSNININNNFNNSNVINNIEKEKENNNKNKEDNNVKNNINNNNITNEEIPKDKYSKSRVERVVRTSVVDLNELNKHNFDETVSEKKVTGKEEVVKED